MEEEPIDGEIEVISRSHSRRSSGSDRSKKSYLTSTPIKKDPYAQDDVNHIQTPSSRTHCSTTNNTYNNTKKEILFEKMPNASTIKQCIKLKREINKCYRRMSFRVEEMLLENSTTQEKAEIEHKLRRRSSSRSRRSKGNTSPERTTPVRRSSRLLKAKNGGKVLTDENNNGIQEDNKLVENTMSCSFLHAPLDITMKMKRWVRKHPFIDFVAPFAIFAIFAMLLFFVVNHFIAEDMRVNIINYFHNFGRRVSSKVQALMQ